MNSVDNARTPGALAGDESARPSSDFDEAVSGPHRGVGVGFRRKPRGVDALEFS